MDMITSAAQLLELEKNLVATDTEATEKHWAEYKRMPEPGMWDMLIASKKARDHDAKLYSSVETAHKAVTETYGAQIQISPDVAKFLYINTFGQEKSPAANILAHYQMTAKDGKYYLESGKIVNTRVRRGGNSRNGTDYYSIEQSIAPVGIAKDITIKQIEEDVETTKANQTTVSANAEYDTPKADKPRFRHLEGKWVQQENGRSGNEDSGLSK